MATLLVVPPPMKSSLPLYAIEETFATYLETAEMVPPEQEAEFLAEFAAVLTAAVEKRDRTGQFLAHLEAQIGLAAAEIKRLQERKAAFERALQKCEEYVIRVIQSLGTDAKGKPKKLEGHTVTFALRKNPPCIEIRDEPAIPEAYKVANACVKMPAALWGAFLDSLDLEMRALLLDGARVEFVPSKTAIKAALENGEEVPGAEIAPTAYRLERK